MQPQSNHHFRNWICGCGSVVPFNVGAAEDVKHELYHIYGEPYHRRVVDLQ